MESRDSEVLRDDPFIQIGTDILGLSPTNGSGNSTPDLLTQESFSTTDLHASTIYKNNDSSQDECSPYIWESYRDRPDVSVNNDNRSTNPSHKFTRGTKCSDQEKISANSGAQKDVTGIDAQTPFLADFIAVSTRMYCHSARDKFFRDLLEDTPLSFKTEQCDINEDELSSIRKYLQETPRGHVILNLYETEKNYVSDLKVFTKDIKTHIFKHNILSNSIITLIFSGCEDIYDIHMSFYDNITLLVKPENWNSHTTCIGYLFLYYMDRLEKVYLKFIDSYAVIQRILKKEEMNNAKYQAFVKAMFKSYNFGRRQVKDFLILPVQRTSRYRMILKDFLRLTPNDHPDTPDLRKSLESISSLVSLINEKKRAEEGATGLFEAYEITRNCPPTLISSNRSLIHTTDVTNACNGKPCRIYLCSDLLMIAYKCNKHSIQLTKDKDPYMYKFDKWIDLQEIKLKEVNTSPTSTILRIFLDEVKHSNSITYPKLLNSTPLVFDFVGKGGSRRRLEFLRALENQVNLYNEFGERGTMDKLF